jgi:hypothetical protein
MRIVPLFTGTLTKSKVADEIQNSLNLFWGILIYMILWMVFFSWKSELNRQFSKEEQRANKYMKTCSISSAIKGNTNQNDTKISPHSSQNG